MSERNEGVRQTRAKSCCIHGTQRLLEKQSPSSESK